MFHKGQGTEIAALRVQDVESDEAGLRAPGEEIIEPRAAVVVKADNLAVEDAGHGNRCAERKAQGTKLLERVPIAAHHAALAVRVHQSAEPIVRDQKVRLAAAARVHSRVASEKSRRGADQHRTEISKLREP